MRFLLDINSNMYKILIILVVLFNLTVNGVWGQSNSSDSSSICNPSSTRSIKNEGQQRIVCYYGSWSVYRPGDGRFSIENIDPTKCSHLIYTFVGLTNSSTIRILDAYNDLTANYGKGGYRRFAKLREINPYLKVLISVGGENQESGVFSRAFSSASQRENFVRSVMSFLRVQEFDGLDIDWEYPTQAGGSPDDRDNFSELIKALRTEFDKCGYVLTAHVAPYLPTFPQSYNVHDLPRYLDFINLGTYNTHRPTERRTGHNSPLYKLAVEANSTEEFKNIDSAVQSWLTAGTPPNKLVVGVGFFGRAFLLSSADCNTPRCRSTGAGPAGPFTEEAGFLGYNEICFMIRNSTVVYDDEAKVPYLVAGRVWVSYDNEKSMQEKVDYVIKRGLGGIVVWSIDTDDINGNCGSGPFPLLNSLQRLNNFSSISAPPVPPRPQITPKPVVTTESPRIPPISTRPTRRTTTRIPTPSTHVTSSSETSGCYLPEFPSGGRYKLLNSKNKLYQDDTVPVNTILEYSCKNNYEVTTKHSFCQEDSTWSTSPSCKKKCRLPTSNTVDFICYDSTQRRIECTQFVSSESVVRFKCKDFHRNTNNLNYAMSCDEGSFDYGAPRCDPDCGLEPAFAEALIIDGIPTKRGTFPWHVAIYELRGERFPEHVQICGGTLVATTVVISAAHCFYSPALQRTNDEDMYRIAVGKYHRNWDDEDDNTLQTVQKSKIRLIKVPDTYRGSILHHQSDIAILQLETPIAFSNAIHPACLRLNDDEFDLYQTKAENYGKVAGWGLTTADGDPSNELRYLNVPVIGFNQCLKEMEKYSFQQFLSIDKLCAGYLNGSAVCKGDSGGGLVFSDVERTTGFTRWYLRGVVSVGPSDSTQLTCRRDTYTAYTRVYHFNKWISDQFAILNI